MPFHVYVFEQDANPRGRGRTGQGYYFRNLSEEQLRARIIAPWDLGQPMNWDGRTADSRRALNVKVFETADPIPTDIDASASYPLMEAGIDVTNDWIIGAAGAQQAAALVPDVPATNPRRVMVVHGRNADARVAMFTFLRALDLDPIEWEDAVEATGLGSPHNLAAVRAAMSIAQAVVVVLTAEDQAGLLPELASPDSPDTVLEGQPRQNVALEAGMAIGIDPARTILVQLGVIRGASDFDGLNNVRLTNEPTSRRALARRLATAGCPVDDTGGDWLTIAAGDFEGCVVAHNAATTTAALDEVMAIPTTSVLNYGVQLDLLCWRLPDGVRVICQVTPPAHEAIEAEAPGDDVGGGHRRYAFLYPGVFEGAPGVAGTHAVSWIAATAEGERRELITTDFRIP